MGSVVQFGKGKGSDDDVVKTAEAIYERAKRGETIGLMVTEDCGGEHRSLISGTYRADPKMAMEMAAGSMQELFAYAAHKVIDPMTATDFF